MPLKGLAQPLPFAGLVSHSRALSNLFSADH